MLEVTSLGSGSCGNAILVRMRKRRSSSTAAWGWVRLRVVCQPLVSG